MRLRLVIRRHGLPDTAIIWAIDIVENPTIAQLLEQVNEVVPLESGADWGLEDYAVELRGSGTNFECLHFQLVTSILHQDDELLIRPLLTRDLKLRKVAGRRQITSDGKHLFDGATFGRPRPRGLVDRPAVEIPPRKRRKITNEENVCGSTAMEPFTINDQEDAVTYDTDNRQLVLRADFDDDEFTDDDYEPSDDSKDEDMRDDVSDEDLQYESSKDGGFSSDDPLLDDLPHEKMRMAAQELREAFPKAPMSVCKSVLLRCNGDLKKTWETLTHGFKPSTSRKVIEENLRNQGTVLAKENTGTKRSARHKRRMLSEKDVDPLDEKSDAFRNDYHDSLLEYYDQHGLPGGTISTGDVLSQMAKIASNMGEPISKRGHEKPSTPTPRLGRSDIVSRSKKSGKLAIDNHATGDLEGVAMDEDDGLDGSSDLDGDTSDEDSDISSSESSDDSNDADSKSSGSSGSSDAGLDSDSDSDSEPDEVPSKPMDIPTKQATPPKPKNSSQGGSLPGGLSAMSQPTVPPGAGKKSTKKRNQRRRNANALRRFQEKGILPAGTTISEFEQLDMDRITTPRDALEALSAIHTKDSRFSNKEPKNTPKEAEFEARRQQLLAAIASGGIEVGPGSSSSTPKRRSCNITGTLDSQMPDVNLTSEDIQLKTSPKSLASANGDSAKIDETASSLPNMSATAVRVSGDTVGSVTDPAPRSRRKLDIGAAGRLVFGALGVRTPKTKAEQEKVRNDLMKHVRPTQPASNVGRIADTVDPVGDPDAWEKIINLRAVECCDEGIELAPAPFPFIQRWDPQQQGNYGQNIRRGSKGKKNQRNQAHFYEDEQRVSRKRKRNSNDLQEGFYDQYSEAQPGTDEIDDYQENEVESKRGKALGTDGLYSDGIEGEVNEQLMRDVQEAAATSQSFDDDDLPVLPEDISTLSDLSAEHVNTGMVIAFKHLVMSEATNWQPQISNYLTAVVIKVLEYGVIELTLAKRDRDRPEMHYDGLTGERIYGKFDMPGDDEDEEEDDGFRSLTFAELIEPRIVQNAPENLISPKASVRASAEAPHEKINASNDESTTLGHEDSADEPKVSIEDVPQVDGTIDGVEEHLVGNDNPQTTQPQSKGDERSLNDADEILNIKESTFRLSVPDREEILNIIKEAGFRSNVPSSITRSQPQLPRTPAKALQNRPSPKFHSPDSSPPQVLSSPSNDKIGWLNSTPAEVIQGHSNASDVHYPRLSVPSSLASQVTDYGRQPDFPSPGEDTLREFGGRDYFLGAQDDQPAVESEFPSAQPSSVGIETRFKLPSMPPSEIEPDFPTLDEILTTRSSMVPKQEVLKPLELTIDRMREAKVDEEYNKAMEELDATLDAVDDADQVSPKASKSCNHAQFKLPNVSPKAKLQTKKSQTAKSQTTRSQFVIPPGSQQVDLTLSSDVEVEAEKEKDFDDLYDSFGLPSGPGWVEKKKRKTRKSTSKFRSASQPASYKSRLTRRKTTTRF